MPGILIVLEGLDGSGKATQAKLLRQALETSGIPVKQISFPDYTQPSSALVKMYLNGKFGTHPEDVNAYAASSFYAVDRYASYKRYWQKEYQQGTVIIADRYVTSNLIFQLSKMNEEEWDDFAFWAQDYEYDKLGLPRPSLTLYLDMPPYVSQKLLLERYQGLEEKKDIHEKDISYLERCRKSALYMGKKLSWKWISCAKEDLPRSIEEIHSEIMQILEETFFYAGISGNKN